MKPGVSVVIPAYQSTKSLQILAELIPNYLEPHDFEIIYVDDGSSPDTWTVIRDLSTIHNFARGIRLGRNAGQHAALVAGIRSAQHELTLTIDDDLQHPPDQIPFLLNRLTPNVDVVYGYPIEVAQNMPRRISSQILRWLLAFGLKQPQSIRASAFSLFRTQLREAFNADLGPGVSLDALLGWATKRIDFVEVRHDKRAYNKSNYSLRKLFRFAFEIVIGYSTLPLRVSLRLGLLTILFGMGSLVWIFGSLLVTGESVAGFPFLASTIAIFAGVQLFSLGILGEYVGIIHQRVMRKPSYYIAEMTGTIHPTAGPKRNLNDQHSG